MKNQEIKNVLELQKLILKEIENLHYGDQEASVGEKVAETVVKYIGSWKFIILQSFLLFLWIMANVVWLTTNPWDPYPFILLNLGLSFQAAYASPLILMATNLADRKDRHRSIEAYRSIATIEKIMLSMQQQFEIIDQKNQKVKTPVMEALDILKEEED